MSSNNEYNFNIEANGGAISKRFIELGLKSFIDTAGWVHDLPYRRNKEKLETHMIFNERCGTCSTKHALLKRLAIENNQHQLRLYLGIYKMNSTNTKAVANCLSESQLSYIPEAHTYLKVNGRILDLTGIRLSERTFDQDLLLETEISPEQIGDFKVAYHRNHIHS